MNEVNKSSRRMSPVFQVKFTGATLRRWMALYAEGIRESEQLLTDLDALHWVARRDRRRDDP